MKERKHGAFEAYSLDFVIDEARKYLADRNSDIEEGDWLRILDAASWASRLVGYSEKDSINAEIMRRILGLTVPLSTTDTAWNKGNQDTKRSFEFKPRFHMKAGYLKNSILEIDDLEELETGMRVSIIGSIQLNRKVAGFSEGDDLSPSVFIHPNTTLNEVVLAVFYDPETI